MGNVLRIDSFAHMGPDEQTNTQFTEFERQNSLRRGPYAIGTERPIRADS